MVLLGWRPAIAIVDTVDLSGSVDTRGAPLRLSLGVGGPNLVRKNCSKIAQGRIGPEI